MLFYHYLRNYLNSIHFISKKERKKEKQGNNYVLFIRLEDMDSIRKFSDY